jgi:hypothetical protein
MDGSINLGDVINTAIYATSAFITVAAYARFKFDYLTAKSNNEHAQARTEAEIKLANANAEVESRARQEQAVIDQKRMQLEAELMKNPNYISKVRADLAERYLKMRQERINELDNTSVAHEDYKEQIENEFGTLKQFLDAAVPERKEFR